MTTADVIGWTAAGIFPLSYFARKPLVLVSIQLAAALVWIAYGIAIRSTPVIVANVMTSSAAVFSVYRFARMKPHAADP